MWAYDCSVCGFTIFSSYILTNHTNECTQDCRNYVHNISGTFQETTVQGICRKRSHQRVRVWFAPKFCLCMYSLPLPPRIITLLELTIQSKIQYLLSGQLQKKTRDLGESFTRACDMVTWCWSADTLFWQLSINYNMDVRCLRFTHGNGATLLFFMAYGRTYGQSRNNENFWDQWVTKFCKEWGSARVPSARRSFAIKLERGP